MPTVAAIIIGNEILTGKFADENGLYLIRRCRELGADLIRMVVIPDEPEVIARAVREYSDAADLVVTSGGVGPTHDDVTLESIGRAFGAKMHLDPRLEALLHRFKVPINDASLRMATVPEGTEIIQESETHFPVLLVRNVFVLPGVPKLFAKKFEAIAARFAGPALITARVHTDERETAIAARLSAVVDEFPDVAIGSYPRYDEATFAVVLTLESRDAARVHEAERAIHSVINVVPAPED